MAILVMSLVMAYVSFVTAEHLLHVSGVMAAVSAALAMGAYGVTRIPPSAMKLTYETWEVIALICNSLLFLMVGLSVDIGVVSDLFLEIIVVAILVIAARARYPSTPSCRPRRGCSNCRWSILVNVTSCGGED